MQAAKTLSAVILLPDMTFVSLPLEFWAMWPSL